MNEWQKTQLEEARKIINEVDSQMAELFVKRMRAAEMVYEYKKEFGLPILDQKREDKELFDIFENKDIDGMRDMMRHSTQRRALFDKK